MIFETIKPHTKGRWARPQVTMNARGQMKLSRVAFEMLGEPERVRVLFDTVTQTIALARPRGDADELTHECISHAVHGRHGGRLIKIYGIHDKIEGELYTCIRFKDIRLDQEGRLILELSKSVPAYNGTRIGMYHIWQENQRKKQREWNKKTYEAERNRTGRRTWEEYRSDQALASMERTKRIEATKSRLRAERDLAREQRKLEKERKARELRDQIARDKEEALLRARREQLEQNAQAFRRLGLTPPWEEASRDDQIQMSPDTPLGR